MGDWPGMALKPLSIEKNSNKNGMNLYNSKFFL